MSRLNNRDFIIQARKGTAAELTAYSGLLYEGEFAYATDTNLLYVGNASGVPQLIGPGGGGGSPGGSTKQVQYNNTGAFDGAAGFVIEGAGEEGCIALGKSLLAATGTTPVRVLSADPDNYNSWLGNAGNLTATGQGNHGAGHSALAAVTSGGFNLAAGFFALAQCTSGGANVAIGQQALYSNISGNSNVALGSTALYSLTSGGGANIAIGTAALFKTTTATANVALGASALHETTDGGDNIAIGASSMFNNVHGGQNVAIGGGALNGAGPYFSVAVGAACLGVSNGTHQVGIGYLNLNSQTTGNGNVAIGAIVGLAVTTAGANVFIGYNTANNVTGGGNIVIGYNETQITSGQNNVSIGYQAGIASGTTNNQLVIQNFIYGTGLNGTGTTISAGKIGIGKKAPDRELDIAGALGVRDFCEFIEMTAPAGDTDKARVFAKDNGAGKTQLCVQFPSGAVQVLATEP